MRRTSVRGTLWLCAALCLALGAWSSEAAAQLRVLPLDKGAQIPATALQQPTALVFGKQLTAQTALTQPVFRVLRLPTKLGEPAALSCTLHRLDTLKVRLPDGQVYDRLLPGGLTAPSPVGHPEQFSRVQLIRIPDGQTPAVAVDRISWKLLAGQVNLPPRQPPFEDVALPGGMRLPTRFVKDAAAYARQQIWPPAPVQLKGTVRIRGETFAVLTYTPIAYNPSMKQAFLAADVNWRLTFGPVGNEPVPIPEMGAALPAAARRALDVRPVGMQVVGVRIFPMLYRVTLPSQADYLVITADKFLEEIQPLVDWKRQKGYNVYVARRSAVGASHTQITQYISNAYHGGGGKLKYVLLVGDQDAGADGVPGVPLVGHPSVHHGPTHQWVTDHDYACVDGADLFPDLALGRLSADTEAEVTRMVENILRYEKTPVAGNWYKTALISTQYQSGGGTVAERWFCETSHRLADFLGPDYDFFGSWNGHAGADPRNKGYTIHTAIEWGTAPAAGTTLYYRADSYPWRMTQPSPVPAKWKNQGSGAAAQISAAINAGAGIAFHRDPGWSGASGRAHPHFTTFHVNALTNGTKQPVVISPDCQTGWIDNKDAFAEAWVRHASGGAVGFLGANRNSFSGPNDVFCIGLMDTFWNDYTTEDNGVAGVAAYPNSWRVAEASDRAKAAVLSTYGTTDAHAQATCRMYTWLGDPEMMLRTRDPFTLYVAHEIALLRLRPGKPVKMLKFTVSRPKGSVRVLVSDALVCVRPAGTALAAYGVASRCTTGSQGVGYMRLNPTPGQAYSVTVTAHNAIPYQAEVVLVQGPPTSTPQTPTQCQPAQTVCPAVPTSCPERTTQCPRYRCITTETIRPVRTTHCPRSQTRCPTCYVVPAPTIRPMNTQCPTQETLCPRQQTQCPACGVVLPPTMKAVSTKCPMIPTRCPRCAVAPPVTTKPLMTRCPKQATQCPACVAPLVTVVAKKTVCPQAKTSCPTSTTTCPRRQTVCPTCGTIPVATIRPQTTRCPAVRTQCPPCMLPVVTAVAKQTSCPVAATWCPATDTRCPPRKTVCPKCAAPATSMGQTTACPLEKTRCPACYAPQVTVVAKKTTCPVARTRCPTTLTACPPVSTRCPPKKTTCPPTCAVVPLLTAQPRQTACPVVKTQCPARMTTCPKCATVPLVTRVPQATKCPEERTKCPMCLAPLFTTMPRETVCPLRQTACPPAQTRCPPIRTSCPVCPGPY